MNLEQMKARLAEIIAELGGFEGLENITEENVATMNALSEEFDGLQGKIQAVERMEEIKAKASTPVARKTAAPAPKKVEVLPKASKTGGFKNFGEFLMATKNSSNGRVDPKFQNNTMFERDGESGGYLVPDEFLSDVHKKIGSDESLLAKTRQFSVTGNNLTFPVDELQPWNGGVTAYWVAESNKLTESGGKFGEASLKLNKLAALVKVSEELLEDSVALESYIREMAPVAITHQINNAIISGTGVGKPEGILKSGFKIAVAKEAGQAADTIVARNIINMYARLIPASRSRSAWYINPECEPQLMTMKDDNGNFIYLAPGSQMNQTPYGMLMGLPVYPLMGAMKQLGDEGDIILADLSYYYSILKAGGLKSAISSHLYFDYDLTAFKFTFRVDGKIPFKTPVQVENGDYTMSGIITLADRA